MAPRSVKDTPPKRRRKIKAAVDDEMPFDEMASAAIYACPICGCYRPNLIKACRVPSCPKGKVAAPIDTTEPVPVSLFFWPRATVWVCGFFMGAVVSAMGFSLYLVWVQP